MLYTNIILTAIFILLIILGGKIVDGFNAVIQGLSAIYLELKNK